MHCTKYKYICQSNNSKHVNYDSNYLSHQIFKNDI